MSDTALLVGINLAIATISVLAVVGATFGARQWAPRWPLALVSLLSALALPTAMVAIVVYQLATLELIPPQRCIDCTGMTMVALVMVGGWCATVSLVSGMVTAITLLVRLRAGR